VLPDPPDALRPVRTDTGRLPERPSGTLLPRRSAVLVLIYPDDRDAMRVILTERTGGGRVHDGEVSFPGGKTEPEDVDPSATALREAAEEVRLDPVAAGVEVLGELATFWIPASNFSLTPVVAIAARSPELEASPGEVAAILRPPLEAFLPGAPITIVERTIRGWPLRYGGYPVEGRLVWGATARILGQLGAILGGDR
jgi:8-oxo-dGTP pyrophosphatase MutT (NUDIX family)